MALGEARWEALGTSVHLLVTDEHCLDVARVHVAGLLENVDRTYSRFRHDSELAAVNRAAGSPVTLSPLLARAVDVALRAAAATDGSVDPTIGRALRAIGYDADFESLPARASAPTIRLASVPGWSAVRFDAATRTLRLPRGVELDLGSTGKALAADLAARAALELARDRGVLVNLGGDIAVAGKAPDGGWRVALADDARQDPATVAGSISIGSGAVATSSTVVRRWRRGGIERHHIVDPATGLPAAGPWRTATVVATDCVAANAAATAAIVKGDAAPAWLEALCLPARLVASDGAIAVTSRWPSASAIEPSDMVVRPRLPLTAEEVAA